MHRRERPGLTGPQPRPQKPAQRVRREAVQRRGGAVAVTDAQQEQPARPQRGDETIEDERGVRDAVEQEGDVNNVEGPGGQRHRPQVAKLDRPGGRPAARGGGRAQDGPGRRAVLVHRGDTDLAAAGAQLVEAEVPGRCLAPGPQHGHRPPQGLIQMVAYGLGEQVPARPGPGRRRRAGPGRGVPGPHRRVPGAPGAAGLCAGRTAACFSRRAVPATGR